MTSSEDQIVQAAHAATSPGHANATEELPNFITLLHDLFPQCSIFDFFHRWENVFFSFLILGLIAVRITLAARKDEFIPKGLQNRWEFVVESVTTFVTDLLGPKGIEHVPYLGTVFIYILLQNWLGMIPLMKSPTSAWSTTIALALFTTFYVQWVGIKSQGFGHYIKHMAGNPQGFLGLLLVPLMLVINFTIEYLAVPLSLSLRLFANVSSEDKLLYKFAELNVMYKMLPFVFQLFANILVIIFSLVQAFVFFLLTTVYIALISPQEGHGHGEKVDSPH